MGARIADLELEEIMQGLTIGDLRQMVERMELDIAEIKRRICSLCAKSEKCLLCAHAPLSHLRLN
jgi:uncharacterized coiled-coil protein SlyX